MCHMIKNYFNHSFFQDIEKGEFPSFIYHRMDLYDNDTLSIAGFCTRDNSVVLKNNATVKVRQKCAHPYGTGLKLW